MSDAGQTGAGGQRCGGARPRFGYGQVLSLGERGGIAELELSWDGRAPLPGQFFMLRPQRFSHFLGRAISVHGYGSRGEQRVLRFLVAPRGPGSRELASLAVGERVLLAGPSGRPWPREGLDGRRLALVSGGVGIAHLAFLAHELPAGSYDFHAGFRSGSFGLEGLRPASLCLWTEDASEGRAGLVTQGLDPSAYDLVYACGPEAMLAAVARSCAAAGTECWLSLERGMACGVGACLGCVVRTSRGNKRCCADGPVFDAKELFFDER